MFGRLGAGFGGLGTIGEAAAAVDGTWEPTDLGADLLAWWNADDPSVGAVTTWTDRIGALAPTQGVAGSRPSKSATSFNSAYAGVTFDGSADHLLVASTGTLPIGTNGSSIHVLASQDQAAGVTTTRSMLSYGASGTRSIQRIVTTGVNRLRMTDATTSLSDTTHDFSGAHILSSRFDAAVGTPMFDGKATSPASGALVFNTGAGNTCIGASGTGLSSFWLGVIRHIFVTNPLSVANRQRLEGWMAHESDLTANLDAGHPYKSVAP
jgi:hypothetical protein